MQLMTMIPDVSLAGGYCRLRLWGFRVRHKSRGKQQMPEIHPPIRNRYKALGRLTWPRQAGREQPPSRERRSFAITLSSRSALCRRV